MKVFVSGCYDMLHSGHVAFLEEAASHGDLYVGLGSDKTIYALKNRKTINSEQERLYMIKALRCVKDAWVNSGSGIMDFANEVEALKPDIFFVNTDGFTPAKQEFCNRLGIRLIVSSRIPHGNLPARSTTAIRQECRIPYRVELCGGWMDQPAVNSLHPGPVVVMSIEPTIEFNDRSGMATSSRKKAIELWGGQLPAGNRQELARQVFCMENPPGTLRISGSQDQLGILLPGVNILNYDNGYWPVSIESITDDETLSFIAEHLYLIQLPQRQNNYDVYGKTNINATDAARLADAAERCWAAIKAKDAKAWGQAATDSFLAQTAMFPNMRTQEMDDAIRQYGTDTFGWKVTGCGGGGYLLFVSDKPVRNALKIAPVRTL